MNEQTWHFLPIEYTKHPFESFAYDDLLMHLVSEDHINKARTWVHDEFVILGLQDMRLPNLESGIKFLEDSGMNYIVRNSGGLGVVLDKGILNLSMIVHKDEASTIEIGYELMFNLMKDILPHETIDAYEIVGSYCPGNFDLSIGGKKFAGISQRRIRDGVSIQIYIAVMGSGADRARIMKEFYSHARAEESSKFMYPKIVPDVMASLSELTGEPFTVELIEGRIKDVLTKRYGGMSVLPPFDKTHEDYKKFLLNMKKRNARFDI
ncbi:biotin/lipoate A/B protein ligase family protein [Phocicoccus pinnipedialis]|uniref:Octanoyl-[GcvH]:protein N-octanoyltransferase n=1 Tax=Phocicoccus pinnipedialis TaxID=110845 RepID=A0A6V7R3N5_9BACL|nr:lipoate--protein ligase family protein [Jeotgalicoccus pinnipedialis]MBP1940033.1 octanoyl-[GcvH]:protein N-octanoyltransferase [Jeotgalicoccus pinnipedialis]CAD2072019.1 Octanoyl-[GcvH]:protein N-octanoyltransferase [Jeotgalicoccus pinnipedialis]